MSEPSHGPVKSVSLYSDERNPAYQAYQILHVGFAVLPVIAGLDKFFHILVNWDLYLAPFLLRLSLYQAIPR
jgi:hypothetical protein